MTFLGPATPMNQRGDRTAWGLLCPTTIFFWQSNLWFSWGWGCCFRCPATPVNQRSNRTTWGILSPATRLSRRTYIYILCPASMQRCHWATRCFFCPTFRLVLKCNLFGFFLSPSPRISLSRLCVLWVFVYFFCPSFLYFKDVESVKSLHNSC